MALSEADIKKIQNSPAGKQILHKHIKGLALRESRKGTLTWQAKYTFEGKQHRIDYGNYPEVNSRQAEDVHKETELLLKEGIDPKQERSQGNVDNVKSLCLKWLALFATKQRIRPEIAERDILVDIIPAIGHIKLSILRKRHVHACIDPIIERESTAHARKILALFRQICNWGVERDYLQVNPTANIKKSNIHKPKPRERYLNNDEIAIVWNKLPNLGLSVQVVLALKILILTGQRRREITFAIWRNIDFNKKIWFIPKTDSKNYKPNKVPLSNLAIKIFKELKSYAGNSAFVMPSHLPGVDRHMSLKVLTRAVARKQKDFNIEHWTPHDLRSTFITGCRNIGIEIDISELTVNHSLSGNLRHYLFSKSSEEVFGMQRKAIEQWAQHVESLV